MKIGLLGYGRMGKAIEKIALERGHEIVYKLDQDYNHGNLINADVAINFSIPNSAVNNITIALESSIPVICGTTGWLDHYKKVTQIALHNKTAFLYASNFSIGVNLFFKLNKTLAKIVQNQSDYKAYVEEIHHIHKLDAPSGTAITLAEGILENSNLKQWCKQDAGEDELEMPRVDGWGGDRRSGTEEKEYGNEYDAEDLKNATLDDVRSFYEKWVGNSWKYK